MQMNHLTASGSFPIISTRVQTDTNSIKDFRFNQVLGPSRTQEEVFYRTGIDQLIEKVIDGYHVTIFAYGQTGAGKTFTMDGFNYMINSKQAKVIIDRSKKANWGIIPRAISYLYEKINKDTSSRLRTYTVYCSYLQIYNEKIYDLLNSSQPDPSAPGLKLRYKNGNFIVENLYTFECKSENDAYDLLQFGLRNRIVAGHRLNRASSRSHSILCLTVESVDPANPVITLTTIGRLCDK